MQQFRRVNAGRGFGLRARIIPLIHGAARITEVGPIGNLRRRPAVKGVNGRKVLFQASVKADIHGAEFIYLRNINIHVNDFGVRRERVELTRGAVVKTRADNNQQVAFLHGVIGGFEPVHAEHAEIIRMIGRQCAETFQGRDPRNLRALDQLAQLCHAVALRHAAADIK